jgi:hypothetical protein
LLLGDFNMSSAEDGGRGGFVAPVWDDATDNDKRSYLAAILADVDAFPAHYRPPVRRFIERLAAGMAGEDALRMLDFETDGVLPNQDEPGPPPSDAPARANPA